MMTEHSEVVRQITKIGLAVSDGERVLLVRKRGGGLYILPGGKPEVGEDDLQTLVREIFEELGCQIALDRLAYVGSFTDAAADSPGIVVTIRLYAAPLIGIPTPHAEIESLLWWDAMDNASPFLAPSLRNQILPHLCASLVDNGFDTRRQNISSSR